jgi:hypothetical protein
LSEHQVIVLEEEALPRGKLFLARPPRVADIRHQLAQLGAKLRAGHTSINGLQDRDTDPRCERQADDTYVAMVRQFAMLLLSDAAMRLGGYRLLTQSPIPDERLPQILTLARYRLPRQARHRLADPRPIRLIWDALMQAHDRMFPNSIHLTWSPGSEFREIVQICYEVLIGGADVDPERAIKSFARLEWTRDERAQKMVGVSRELAFLGVPPAKRKGRRRETLVPRRR